MSNITKRSPLLLVIVVSLGLLSGLFADNNSETSVRAFNSFYESRDFGGLVVVLSHSTSDHWFYPNPEHGPCKFRYSYSTHFKHNGDYVDSDYDWGVEESNLPIMKGSFAIGLARSVSDGHYTKGYHNSYIKDLDDSQSDWIRDHSISMNYRESD